MLPPYLLKIFYENELGKQMKRFDDDDWDFWNEELDRKKKAHKQKQKDSKKEDFWNEAMKKEENDG